MSKIKNSVVLSVIWSLILGNVSFLISGVIACIIILKTDNYILGNVGAGGIGGLILGLFHWKYKMVGKMTIASIIAVPVGLLGSFMVAEGIVGGLEFLFPSFYEYFGKTGIADVIAIIFMGVFFGLIFGAIVYGRKSIVLFPIICGAVSIPCALLVRAMNLGNPVKALLGNLFQIFGKIDFNLLVIIAGFGAGIGLSIGLLNVLEQKRSNI